MSTRAETRAEMRRAGLVLVLQFGLLTGAIVWVDKIAYRSESEREPESGLKQPGAAVTFETVRVASYAGLYFSLAALAAIGIDYIREWRAPRLGGGDEVRVHKPD